MRSFYPFTAVVTLVAAGGALASALSQPSANPFSSPNNTTSSPTSSPTGSPNPNAPVCGAGFTYCGYILRDHRVCSFPYPIAHPLFCPNSQTPTDHHHPDFNEDDIVNTYCEAHKDNCVNGRAKTDPLQALYICLPSNANPLEAWADSSSRVVSHGISHNHNDKQNQHQQPVKVSLSDRQVDHLHQNNKNNNNNNNNNNPKSTHRMLPNLHIISEEEDGKPSSTRQAPTSVQPPETPHSSSSSSSQEPPSAEPPQAPQPSQSSISSSSSNNGGDSCASSLTLPGNKIELLCSCGRQCLNPLSDHIARCDGPCSS